MVTAPVSRDFDRLGALAAKAQAGDTPSYEVLLGELYQYVRMVLRSRLGAIPELDDITQECLLGMHRSLPSYHPSRSLRPWVQAIIRYKIVDHFRSQSRRREVFLPEEMLESASDTSDAEVADEDARHDGDSIRAMVARLPEDLRRAVVLTKLDGLSGSDAARAEGVSAAALRKRVSRAYRKLARMVESEQS